MTAFRIELAKQVRRPRTYVCMGAMAIVPIIMAVALKANPPKVPEGRGFFFLAGQTGLFLPIAALAVMSQFLLVFVLAVFAGDAVAGEANWGNLRYVLVRPVRRSRLLAVKLATTALLALTATLLVVLSGLVVGFFVFGWKALPPIVQTFGFDLSNGEIVARLALATVYVTWGLVAVIAFGFMVSTMTDTPAGAIGGGIGLYITSQILNGIPTLGGLRHVLPTHYLDAWSSLFGPRWDTSDMVRGALLQIPYLLVFCAIAWWWFHKKDIVS